MKVTILGIPEFEFSLTPEQIEVLMKLSARHYDGLCRFASQTGSDGSENGFLVNWKNNIEAHREFAADEPAVLRASFSRLDLTLKIMESSLGLTPDEKRLVMGMRHGFHHALNLANEKYGEWKIEANG